LIKKLIRFIFLQKVKSSNAICLTFDDGPDPQITPLILDILHDYNVQATFFLVGKNALKHPKLVQAIVDGGHEIGEHSFSHSHAWVSGLLRTWKDLIQGKRALEPYMKDKTKIMFRPPFGKLNLVSILYILFNRRKVIFWNVDPKDYQSANAKEVAFFVNSRLKPGSVILLHDSVKNDSVRVSITVGALKMILEHSKNAGLNFTSMRDIIA
jgi:peptidoglycan/xylan/chitin deacetylase (PgdA/CDA1 family)